MYASFFGLQHEPFSIAPDPRYLYMSERHREALAHLLYGVNGGGGFVLLTGEIGAGKTTICRCFLEQVPRRCNVAYIFNPKLSVVELLRTVCDEFRIPHPPEADSVKAFVDLLNEFLLRTHGVGQNNVLIIDEAQNLSADVLEQLRLLTNLETSERKLLQIILIGQPELRQMLAQPQLEQLAQRVIARYHLESLNLAETEQYIRHRLAVAGLTRSRPFEPEAVRRIQQITGGVPRRINLLCDRAMLGAYASGTTRIDRRIVDKAAQEVFGSPATGVGAGALEAVLQPARRRLPGWFRMGLGVTGGLGVGLMIFATVTGLVGSGPEAGQQPRAPASPPPSARASAPDARAGTHAPGPTAWSDAASKAASKPAAGVLSASDLFSRLAALQGNENTAWRELALLWQAELPAGTRRPCDAAGSLGLACFRNDTGLTLLRQLDRPAVLVLVDPQGRSAAALLLGLQDDRALLRLGADEHVVALRDLSQVWRGAFGTYWRVPPSYRGKIENGQTGPAVDWLATQLARLAGEDAPAPPQRLDAGLRSRLYAFQLAQGLKPDGVAGAATLMQLNRVAQVDEPRLRAIR